MTLKVAPINHRWQFGELLNQRGLKDFAVEVGTHRGVFAATFLRVWRGRALYCVDPWEDLPGYEEQAKLLDGPRISRRDDFLECGKNLAEFGDRARLVVLTSEEVARRLLDGSIDFVYLDGDHRVDEVRKDLQRWWPKVKPGGLLAGHDFVCPGEGDGSPDGWGGHIQPAVLEFAGERGLDIRLVIENAPETAGYPWSFYIEKPRA